MSLTFQSLRSSSKGNCLLLRCDQTMILIDCGIKTQRKCRELLDGHASRLDAVLVSHAHGDHVCYSSLRVLQQYRTPVYCHGDVMKHVHRKHVGEWSTPPAMMAFGYLPFRIGCLEIQPVALPHDPRCPTFGFVIRCGGKKLVICTDFHDPDAIADHLPDADFIFIEANHDLDLLRLYPNVASHFHLNNRKTATLLAAARRGSSRGPANVMLGHLSEERNTESLAVWAVHEQFETDRLAVDFKLHVAPRRNASAELQLA